MTLPTPPANRCPLILVAGDDLTVLKQIESHLDATGFGTSRARDAATVFSKARDAKPALVIVDTTVGGTRAVDVCKLLKQSEATMAIPIILVSPPVDEIDRVLAFELGAEDFVTKPFSLRELALRARTIVRRYELPQNDLQIFCSGALAIDFRSHQIRVFGTRVELTPIEFQLLETLAANPGQVQSRRHLFDKIWGISSDTPKRMLDVALARLRKKLGPVAKHIVTEYGLGFRFDPMAQRIRE